MKKSEVKELFLTRGEVAEDIRETYFITSDGTPINLGSRINCCGEIERSVEHNSCFDLFKCNPNDWIKFFKRTEVVQVIPEYRCCAYLEGQHITKKQREFIEKNKLEVLEELKQ